MTRSNFCSVNLDWFHTLLWCFQVNASWKVLLFFFSAFFAWALLFFTNSPQCDIRTSAYGLWLSLTFWFSTSRTISWPDITCPNTVWILKINMDELKRVASIFTITLMKAKTDCSETPKKSYGNIQKVRQRGKFFFQYTSLFWYHDLTTQTLRSEILPIKNTEWKVVLFSN